MPDGKGKRNMDCLEDIQPQQVIQQLFLDSAKIIPGLNKLFGLLVASSKKLQLCAIHINEMLTESEEESYVDWPTSHVGKEGCLGEQVKEVVINVSKKMLQGCNLTSVHIDCALGLGWHENETIFVHIAESLNVPGHQQSTCDNNTASCGTDEILEISKRSHHSIIPKRSVLLGSPPTSSETVSEFVPDQSNTRGDIVDHLDDSYCHPLTEAAWPENITAIAKKESKASSLVVMTTTKDTLKSPPFKAVSPEKLTSDDDEIQEEKDTGTSNPTGEKRKDLNVGSPNNNVDIKFSEIAGNSQCGSLSDCVSESATVGITTQKDKPEEVIVLQKKEDHNNKADLEPVEILIDVDDSEFFGPEQEGNPEETVKDVEIATKNPSDEDLDEGHVFQCQLLETHLKKKCSKSKIAISAESDDEEKDVTEVACRGRFGSERVTTVVKAPVRTHEDTGDDITVGSCHGDVRMRCSSDGGDRRRVMLKESSAPTELVSEWQQDEHTGDIIGMQRSKVAVQRCTPKHALIKPLIVHNELSVQRDVRWPTDNRTWPLPREGLLGNCPGEIRNAHWELNDSGFQWPRHIPGPRTVAGWPREMVVEETERQDEYLARPGIPPLLEVENQTEHWNRQKLCEENCGDMYYNQRLQNEHFTHDSFVGNSQVIERPLGSQISVRPGPGDQPFERPCELFNCEQSLRQRTAQELWTPELQPQRRPGAHEQCPNAIGYKLLMAPWQTFRKKYEDGRVGIPPQARLACWPQRLPPRPPGRLAPYNSFDYRRGFLHNQPQPFYLRGPQPRAMMNRCREKIQETENFSQMPDLRNWLENTGRHGNLENHAETWP